MDLNHPSGPENGSSSNWRLVLGYGAMLAGGALLLLLIYLAGRGLTAPPPPDGAHFGRDVEKSHASVVGQLLVALLTIIGASRLMGAVFARFHQPPVIGEVLAGIMLGPSLLGMVAPQVTAALFPTTVIPLLGVVAQLGVLLFMFLVGLELNTNVLREQPHATVAISHASILAPFLLGAALALALYPTLSSRDVPFLAFALFLGISLSVTAFPVLARILTDRGLHQTPMGILALTCAAVDDVTAWCLLAFVTSVVDARMEGAVLTAAFTLVYIVAMFKLVGPWAKRLAAREEQAPAGGQRMMTATLTGFLLSSLITESIGIHGLFGAFLMGAVIPHDSRVARTLISKLHDFVVVLFLPAFFALTGLRTQIGLISGAEWGLCALIIGVACLGKFGGSAAAARLTGLCWRDAATIGVLMNTRGLMELIVLNIGLEMGVLSPTLFAMLVIMALVTTFATTPLVDLLTRGKWDVARATG